MAESQKAEQRHLFSIADFTEVNSQPHGGEAAAAPHPR